MSVVPLTLTISLCLMFTFVLFFLREFSRRRFSGIDSESLLPLADETPLVITVTVAPRATDQPAQAVESCGNHSVEEEKGTVCLGKCAACRLRALHRPHLAAVSNPTPARA